MKTQLPNIFVDENKIWARTDFLKPWEDNPREIKEEDFERLKQRLSGEQFKPLLIRSDGVVIGGNMRLRAYQELGREKVWVSVISFKEHEDGLVTAYVNNKEDRTFDTKKDAMLHYAFTDNEEFGKYDNLLVAELIKDAAIPLDEYMISSDNVMSLEEVWVEHAPSEEDKINTITPEKTRSVKCPKCGYVFEI